MSKFRRSTNKIVKQVSDGDHNSNWAISYGDMITLLLAFFVLFFNIESDSFKMKLFQKQISEVFGSGQIDEPDRKPDMVWGNSEKAEEMHPAFDRKMKEIPQIETKLRGDKLLVEFPNVSFFHTAQFQLTSEGEEVLVKFADVFRPYLVNMRLVVRGYTDNRPVKAKGNRKFKDNLELSSLRSLSAIRTLHKKGIPLHLMRIGGYGETDKGEEISGSDLLKYDRKIVLVVEPLDTTERNFPAQVNDHEKDTGEDANAT